MMGGRMTKVSANCSRTGRCTEAEKILLVMKEAHEQYVLRGVQSAVCDIYKQAEKKFESTAQTSLAYHWLQGTTKACYKALDNPHDEWKQRSFAASANVEWSFEVFSKHTYGASQGAFYLLNDNKLRQIYDWGWGETLDEAQRNLQGKIKERCAKLSCARIL